MKSLLLNLISFAVFKVVVFLMDSKVYSKRSHLAIAKADKESDIVRDENNSQAFIYP
jgi:hypothetical protein